MKNHYTYLLLAIILTSCSSYNKIITIEDPYKNEHTIRLIQELKGYSDEKRGWLFDGSDYHVKLKTIYIRHEFQKGQVTAELTITTRTRPEELDSLIFIQADDKILRFHSNEYASRQYISHSSSTETTTAVEKEKDEKEDDGEKETTTVTTRTTSSEQSHQIMKRTIEITPDSWVHFNNLNDIMIRFYIDTEGVDVHFTARDRKKLAQFFNDVMVFEQSPDLKLSL